MTIREFAQYRQRYNVPMTELAKEMGVSRSYINNIEKQNASNEGISDETMDKLLQSLYAVINKRNRQEQQREYQKEYQKEYKAKAKEVKDKKDK